MDKMEIGRCAVDGAVHIHRRNDNTIDEPHLAEREWSEHRRNSSICLLARSAAGKPALEVVEIFLVANPQVLMADALAASQQAVGELLRIEFDVSPNVFEPLHGIAGCILQTQGFGL